MTVSVEGVNLEKLLRMAAADGLLLSDARRTGTRRMQIRVRAWQLEPLRALCVRFGWCLEEKRASLPVRAVRFLRRRWMLALALRLPGLSFVGLRYAGSTLICDCRQAVLGERVDVPGSGLDVVAAQPGVITRISAASGTPQVEPGEAVVKGQVLIRGEERTQKGEVRPVRAQGQVSARVYARGEAKVSLKQTHTVETGDTRTRVTLRTPWHTRVVRDVQPFASQDVSRERQAVVGLYLPVWREIETYAETVEYTVARDRGDAASMAQGAAEKIAKEQCPHGVLILDKWVNYCMIDDEFVYATVVLEYETAIAGRAQ